MLSNTKTGIFLHSKNKNVTARIFLLTFVSFWLADGCIFDADNPNMFYAIGINGEDGTYLLKYELDEELTEYLCP